MTECYWLLTEIYKNEKRWEFHNTDYEPEVSVIAQKSIISDNPLGAYLRETTMPLDMCKYLAQVGERNMLDWNTKGLTRVDVDASKLLLAVTEFAKAIEKNG